MRKLKIDRTIFNEYSKLRSNKQRRDFFEKLILDCASSIYTVEHYIINNKLSFDSVVPTSVSVSDIGELVSASLTMDALGHLSSLFDVDCDDDDDDDDDDDFDDD